MVRSGFLESGAGKWHGYETPGIGVRHVCQTLDARARPAH